MNAEELMKVEREFWTGGVDVYRRGLTDDAVMVFPPPVGQLTRQEVLDAIDGAPRWVELDVSSVQSRELRPGCRLLCYRASARRDDETRYVALASSVYVERDGKWKMAFHQQTP